MAIVEHDGSWRPREPDQGGVDVTNYERLVLVGMRGMAPDRLREALRQI